MENRPEALSTGLRSFDRVIQHVLPGDNIVLQVNSVEDSLPFLRPFSRYAIESNRGLVYFRFGQHCQLVESREQVHIVQLDPDVGFESFTTQINSVINNFGAGYYYVFDLLSELAVRWSNDRMLGNFFMETCPHLYQNQTVTMFSLLRDYHSFHATKPITETAQIVTNIYKHDNNLYIHPIKVTGRYSPTMNTIHLWRDDKFIPLRQSGEVTDILSSVLWFDLDSANERHGFWARAYEEAKKINSDFRAGICSAEDYNNYLLKLIRMTISREGRIIALARRYLSITDLIRIRKRMIGTGLIGGKSVGMLLARAIIEKECPQLAELFEPHDSFFIGSDVFYTYLVKNKIWNLRQKQRESRNFLESAEQGRLQIMSGEFPAYIEEQFVNMLDYFGQSPIIVRSSSLLEDNYGNAFAGKYKSYFCANQGNRQDRLNEFMTAVRKIYASSMSNEALTYRAQRGLLQRDEPMALLVQRVSGGVYGKMFYPQCAGVGFSYNPYAWDEDIDPEAGMLRLVFGLGTRAVDRVDDDYTRIIALNAPERRPESGSANIRKYSQRRVDVLDLEAGGFSSKDFREIIDQSPGLPTDFFVEVDKGMRERSIQKGIKTESDRVITFSKLLNETNFAGDMRTMLAKIQNVYGSSVDIEFTMNMQKEGGYRINLLQCRPLEIRGGGEIAEPTALADLDRVIIKACGPVLGRSRLMPVDFIIYVFPEAYSMLSVPKRYEIARLIGKLTHSDRIKDRHIVLIGPGRWGTSTPSLGIPVSYSEINKAEIIIELAVMSENVQPDMSLGTHFFSDLIESDTLYLGLKPKDKENFLNVSFFAKSENSLSDIIPDAKTWSDVVTVIKNDDNKSTETIKLYANSLEQKFACYIDSTREDFTIQD